MRSPADLRRTFLAIDHIFFGDACVQAGLKCRWKKFRDAKNSMVFGEYETEKKEVRLNIRLAALDVPDYVVAAVCYHEMLHYVVGCEHDVAFQRAEHRFPHYYESEAFCDRFLLNNG